MKQNLKMSDGSPGYVGFDDLYSIEPIHQTSVFEYCANCVDYNNSRNISQRRRELPAHLIFNSDSLIVVIAYTILFVIAAVGNLSVFLSLLQGRHRKSRMSLMMTHLTIADMIVTFFMIPLEIVWRITAQWVAGNVACKVFLFFRAFGLYLSSNVLVCVSVDRYFAVIYPFRVNDARRRGKAMLAAAWATSFACSVPQCIVFHVSQHPEYPEFHQCVSFNYFSSTTKETAYNLFCVSAMYFVPLLIISVSYTCILYEILNKSRENRDGQQMKSKMDGKRSSERMWLRRSDITNIERARSRTIKMSITIVAAFVCCWTPYVIMTMWYMFDRASAENVNSRLQDGLFIMAVSNSCVNPLVYGSYFINYRRLCSRCICCCCISRHHRRDTVSLPNTRGTQLLAQNRRYFPNTHQPFRGMIIKQGGCTVSEYNLTRTQLELSDSVDMPAFHSDPGRHKPVGLPRTGNITVMRRFSSYGDAKISNKTL